MALPRKNPIPIHPILNQPTLNDIIQRYSRTGSVQGCARPGHSLKMLTKAENLHERISGNKTIVTP